jgi:hypothetical protein
MAQNRTMNFYGYAYGSTPVSLLATINGVTVFNGAVSTINQPLPAPNVDITDAPVLFSVADATGLFPVDFAGAYPMSIEVTGGNGIVVQNTYCNYMTGNTADFTDCYNGTPSNSEGTPDSRSSVTIDGITQVPPAPASLGQWTWIIPTGSTLACAFNTSLGWSPKS